MRKFLQKVGFFSKRWQAKPCAIYINAFLVSLLIGFCVMLIMGLYPFGDRSILTVDLYHQYTPFLLELRRKLLNGENLFMTLHVGLGVNFWSVMAYYGLSPFNILLLLFKAKYVPLAIWLIIWLKISLSAVTMTAFLNYYYVQRETQSYAKFVHLSPAISTYAQQIKLLAQKKGPRLRLIFSLLLVSNCYAWSGYITAYLWNLMWLDSYVMLPLVALGVSKLIRERKPLIYLLSLTYVICVNYYTAVFVCLFVALYSLVLFFDEAQYRYHLCRKIQYLIENAASSAGEDYRYRQSIETTASNANFCNVAKFNPLYLAVFDFTIFSLLAALLAAPILYPVWSNIQLSSAAHDLWPSVVKWDFGFNQILNRLLAFGEVKIRSGEPNIYVGCLALCLVAVLLYRLYKRPLAYLPKIVLLIFIGLSFSNNYLNFIWHGLHYPNQLPHRFAFVFCFLLLQIVFELIWRFQWVWSKYLLVGACWMLAICLANCRLLRHDTQQAKLYLILNLLFALLYVLISASFTYSTLQRKKTRAFSYKQILLRKSAIYLFVLTTFIELGANALVQIINLHNTEYLPSFSNYVAEMDDKQHLLATIANVEQNNLWRLETEKSKTCNDGALYGYNSSSIFSSTSNEHTAKAMHRLGLNGNNLNSYKVQKPLNFFSDLFALKYFVSTSKEYQDWHKVDLNKIQGAESLLDKKLPWQLWQNCHVGKQAYLWSDEMLQFKLKAHNPYLNYNEFAAKLCDTDKLSTEFDLPSVSSLPSLYNPLVVFVEKSNFLDVSAANNEYELRAVKSAKEKKGVGSKSSVDLTCIASESAEDISLYVDSSNTLYYTASVDGVQVQKHEFGQKEIVQLPKLNKEAKLELHFEFKNNEGFAHVTLAKLNPTVRSKLTTKLAQGFNWQIISSRHLRANLSDLPNKLPTNMCLYTTIPYDMGWRLFVDGQEMQRVSWLDASEQKNDKVGAFLAFRLSKTLKTTSQIDLVFLPTKYLEGLAISLFAAIISSVYIYLLYRRRKGKNIC